MTLLRFSIAVIMQRTQLANRWATESWLPIAVVPGDAGEVWPVCIEERGGVSRWRIPGLVLELHPSESEGLHVNLTSSDPKLFVKWRLSENVEEPRARPVALTASFNEAGRWMDGDEQVDSVRLPPKLRAWIEPFVVEHYKPEPKRKVRRNEYYEGEARHRDPSTGKQRQ